MRWTIETRKPKGLDSPSSNFSFYFSLTLEWHKIVSHFFFNKNTFHVVYLLLFFFHASPRFFTVALVESLFFSLLQNQFGRLAICLHRQSHATPRRKKPPTLVYMSFIRTFYKCFYLVYGRSEGKKKTWVRWREKILKISPTSDRSACPIIRKNLHMKFVSLSPLGVVFRARWEQKELWRLLEPR